MLRRGLTVQERQRGGKATADAGSVAEMRAVLAARERLLDDLWEVTP
ncbi:hypothetical protein [Bailinhaonella thermotolerans]|nr:hypothetical protein [Bailinhaonella thermotolerans]